MATRGSESRAPAPPSGQAMLEVFQMTQAIQSVGNRPDQIHVNVDYLAATRPYEHEYVDDTRLSQLRTDTMAFFGVSDHRDRDLHEFYLIFGGQRVTDLGQTIDQLVGEKHEAKFDLAEQITAGG